MSTVVTVMNMKGGVGKTTVAMHLAGACARYIIGATGRKVLLIDYDPQFNLSQAYLPAKTYFKLESERKTTLSILLDDESKLNPYKLQVPGNHTPPSVFEISYEVYSQKHNPGSLHIVPSTLDLMYVALGQANIHIAPMEERFEKFIDEARRHFDLIIIDCHPAGSVFTQTSLRNSDHVLIPVAPQRYALRGIGLMKDFIKAKKSGQSAPRAHILFNKAPRRGISEQEIAIRKDPDFSELCLKQTLKNYKAFSDPEEGRGFVWSSGAPYSTEAFGNLLAVSREFMSRIGG